MIDPMPMTRPAFKYVVVVVVVDYFTKWAEGKLLATIFSKKVQEFVWESIIYRFRIPYEIISNNSTLFDSKDFVNFATSSGSRKASF